MPGVILILYIVQNTENHNVNFTYCRDFMIFIYLIGRIVEYFVYILLYTFGLTFFNFEHNIVRILNFYPSCKTIYSICSPCRNLDRTLNLKSYFKLYIPVSFSCITILLEF